MTVLFTKEGCGKCEWVKKNINLDSISELKVIQLDGTNPEALATLAYYECVSLSEKQLPILVSESREIITGLGEIQKYLQELAM